MEEIRELDVRELDAAKERARAIGTIVIVAAVNVLNVLGYAADADVWVSAFTSLLSAASIAYAWWKNQNVTPEAAKAQAVLDALRGRHAKAGD